MVGAISGWTSGTVLSTCFDAYTYFGSLPVRLICQGKSNYYSQGGDSGAPIFNWWSWNYDDSVVELLGVHSTRSTTQNYTTFSHWSQVANELGNIYIQYPYF